ncbi:clostripain-related cysteine peptidase [Lignipirellula cremea]|uniref:Clostripain n=1 Tax=Lignipirellula cremea TaxID=2528010 RepID=A0A518DVK7_9BACT|nr:clostripain-related cysteine peptidase [Lignipirellula cremea]QDU95870.1 Clostripain precursor [Lignipirellula cremea]
MHQNFQQLRLRGALLLLGCCLCALTSSADGQTGPNRINEQPTGESHGNDEQPQGRPLEDPAEKAPPGKQSTDPFVGVFEGEAIRLEIRSDGKSYQGLLRFKGQAYPLTADSDGERRLKGEFLVDKTRFPFTAELARNLTSMKIDSDGSEYSAERTNEEPSVPPVSSNGTAGANGGEQVNTAEHAGPAPVQNGPPLRLIDWKKALANLGPADEDPDREWTLIIYFDADNNLEKEALKDMEEIEAWLPESGIDVITLIDRSDRYDQSHDDWTEARMFHMQRDTNLSVLASPVIADLGEVNMSDPEVLEAFVAAALRKYPARRHAVVLWDHGDGWSGLLSDDQAPGADANGNMLNLPDTAGALRNALRQADVPRLDLLGFDMCLMGQLETAVEFAGTADYLISSAAVAPGEGWPYRQILPLFVKGTLGSRRIAVEIVGAYGQQYASTDVATLAALDLAEIEPVITALDAFLAKIQPELAEHWPAIGRSLFFAEAYSDRLNHHRGKKAVASVDMLDLLKRLEHHLPACDCREEFAAAVRAMDRFVLNEFVSKARRLSNGVALYAPVTAAIYNEDYAGLAFARKCSWPAFLKALYQQHESGLTEPVIREAQLTDQNGQPLEKFSPLAGHGMKTVVEGHNLLWTTVTIVQPAADGGLLSLSRSFVVDSNYRKRQQESPAAKIDLVMPVYPDGRDEAFMRYQGVRAVINSGDKIFYCTVDGSDISHPERLRIPILYAEPDHGSLVGEMYFSRRTWGRYPQVLIRRKQGDGRFIAQQVTPTDDAEITFLFEGFSKEDAPVLRKASTCRWDAGMRLAFQPLPPGKYGALFQVESIAGLSTSKIAPFELTPDPEVEQRLAGTMTFDPNKLLGNWRAIDMARLQAGGEVAFLDHEWRIFLHPDEKLRKAGIPACRETTAEGSRPCSLFVDRLVHPVLRLAQYGEGDYFRLLSFTYHEQGELATMTVYDLETGSSTTFIRDEEPKAESPSPFQKKTVPVNRLQP